MARMGRPPADTVQVSVRVPSSWVARADAIAERHMLAGLKSDRASVYRAALARGLEALEVEFSVAKPRGKR